jgi:predicted acetyltransferase
MTETGNAVRIELGNDLVLRTVTCAEDIERIAESHRIAFGEEELDVLTRDTLRNYPGIRWDDIILVEDVAKDIVASSICLLPLRWAYEDVVLKAGMLGIVGTRKEYRHRGLIRTQMELFDRRLREGAYDLTVVEGIPYFYRQYGYEYSIPLSRSCKLPLSAVPDLKEGEQDNLAFRPMEDADWPCVRELMQEAAKDLCISMMRSRDEWLFPEKLSDENPDKTTTHVAERQGRIVGYVRLRGTFKEQKLLRCREMSQMDHATTLAALRFLKKTAEQADCVGINLELPANSNAVRLGVYLGGRDSEPYGWQIRIMDYAAFLDRIKPVLERRLAGSMMAGLTDTVHINLYRDTIRLVFEEGRIASVDSVGKTDEGAIRIPPRMAERLFTCYQSFEELRAFRPDCGVRSQYRALVDALFPKKTSFIYSLF